MKNITYNLKNRICLVTGGTSGVGKAIAAGLKQAGAHVVLPCRDAERGRAAADGMPGPGTVDIMEADLADIASVRACADRFRQKYGVLHVFSSNAAVLPLRRTETVDGIESVFAVNFLSYVLLTGLLRDCLAAGAPSRITAVAGWPWVIRRARFNLDDPQMRHRFNPFKATLQVMLARVLYTMHLAREMEGTGVSAFCYHPGLVRSGLARHFPAVLKPFINLTELFFSRTCRTGLRAAGDPALDGVTGSFLVGKRLEEFKPLYADAGTVEELLRYCGELVG